MNLAWISVAALVAAIAVSCTTRVNVGVLAIAMAWLIGVYAAPALGQELGVKAIVEGFPASLCLTLIGVTLLFMLAQENGTLAKVTRHAVRCCRGNAALVPIMFFLLTALLSTIGAGSIAATALVAPMAMSVARRVRASALLMAIMVGHGAVAGGLSPFALTGVVVGGQMDRIGMSGHQWHTYFHNLLANGIVALGAYLLLGGWRRPDDVPPSDTADSHDPPGDLHGSDPFDARQWFTLAVIAALVAGVILADVDVGMGAFTAAALLVMLRAGDQRKALLAVPWGVILMVSGVTMLVSLVEKTGGMELFSGLLARYSTADTITALMALVTGLVSVFSSTSGVVLPAFLPMVPALAEKLGLADGLPIAMSINIGSGMVDVSPVSTIGALCLASAPLGEDRQQLFNRLLVWGFSMSLVGAVFCYVYFGTT